MKMNKFGYALGICLLLGGAAQASVVVDFRSLNADASAGSVHADDVGVTETITRYVDGNDLVYSFSATGMDLDGGGVNDDSLSWDVRFEAFNAGSYDAVTGMTLGTSTVATNGTTTSQYSSGIDQVWNELESLKFTVENIVLTADEGYVATFDGFDSMWLTTGDYYLGTGDDTTALATTANGLVSFDPVTELVLTAALATERNRFLSGSFTVIPEPATLGLIASFGGGILFIRRRLFM